MEITGTLHLSDMHRTAKFIYNILNFSLFTLILINTKTKMIPVPPLVEDAAVLFS